jgi:hypothetical protein
MPYFNQRFETAYLQITAKDYVWVFQPWFNYMSSFDGRYYHYKVQFAAKGEEIWHNHKPEYQTLRDFFNDINLIDEIDYLNWEVDLQRTLSSSYGQKTGTSVCKLKVESGWTNKLDISIAGEDEEIVAWMAVWKEIQTRLKRFTGTSTSTMRHLRSILLHASGWLAFLALTGVAMTGAEAVNPDHTNLSLFFSWIFWSMVGTFLVSAPTFFLIKRNNKTKKLAKHFRLRLHGETKAKRKTELSEADDFFNAISGLNQIAQRITDEKLIAELQAYTKQALELSKNATERRADLINYTKVLYDVMRNYISLGEGQTEQVEEKLVSAVAGLNLLCDKRNEQASALVAQKLDADVNALNALLQLDGIKK